jgi:site-specific recombinase XerD
MGKHIMMKTGNLAVVQRQLGHKNAAYSMQYSRVSGEEIQNVVNDH